MNKQELEKAINHELSAHGYIKKATTWYRHSNECIILVDLQKSNFGDQYYLNLACRPLALAKPSEQYPKEHKCPIRIRATSALPEMRQQIENLFNLQGSEIDDEVRRQGIRQLMVASILPFVRHFETADTLRIAYNNKLLEAGAVNKSAQTLLRNEK